MEFKDSRCGNVLYSNSFEKLSFQANFSLQYQYDYKQTGDENSAIHQLEDIVDVPPNSQN